jgi:pimeloyl-ACP methyl ester carboxylesterase
MTLPLNCEHYRRRAPDPARSASRTTRVITQRTKNWAVMMPLMFTLSIGAQSDGTDKSPHKSGFVTANNVKLHYLDWGGKGQTLLFLHGMGDTAHIYDNLAPKFTNQFRVLGLTRRGHGESDIPETGYDTATLVEDLRQFLDALKIQRAILAGHSFAGDELTRFAVVHPDRVITLIYFDSAYDHSRVPESLRFKPLHGGGPELFPTQGESESLEGARGYIRRLFGEKRGEAIYSMMEGTYSARAEYGKIKAPALAFFAIGYKKDVDSAEALPEPQRQNVQEFLKAQRKYHEQEIEHFRREIPNGQVIVFTNAAHNCFIDRENEVVREMRVFLATTSPRSKAAGSVALDEATVLAIAKAAVTTNDTWIHRAEFERPIHQPDGSWSVQVWRRPATPGGHRFITIDAEGRVTQYVRGL